MGCTQVKTRTEVEELIKKCLKKEEIKSKSSHIFPQILCRREGKNP